MTAHDGEGRMRLASTGLRWCLGIVILIEAALFLFHPGSPHQLPSTHTPNAIRPVLGWGEVIGCF